MSVSHTTGFVSSRSLKKKKNSGNSKGWKNDALITVAVNFYIKIKTLNFVEKKSK